MSLADQPTRFATDVPTFAGYAPAPTQLQGVNFWRRAGVSAPDRSVSEGSNVLFDSNTSR